MERDKKEWTSTDIYSARGTWQIETQEVKQRSQHHIPRWGHSQAQSQVCTQSGPSLARVSQGLSWMTWKGLRRTPLHIFPVHHPHWCLSYYDRFKGSSLIGGLPRWLNGKESTCQCRRCRCGFDPWIGKIPWNRKWQLAPVFLPGDYHGQRSLAGYSSWGHK